MKFSALVLVLLANGNYAAEDSLPTSSIRDYYEYIISHCHTKHYSTEHFYHRKPTAGLQLYLGSTRFWQITYHGMAKVVVKFKVQSHKPYE